MKRSSVILAAVLLGVSVFVAVVCVFGFVTRVRNLGGLGSGYPANDGDPFLTKTARSALPLIHALDQYWNEHRTYPTHSSENELIAALQPYLSDEERKSIHASYKEVNRWYYFFEEGDAYSLCYRLGWDPSLFYRCKSNQGYWEFDPGDGRPTKTIRLNP